jgi:hypothetical protein
MKPRACLHEPKDVLAVGTDHRWCVACGSLWFRYGGWLPVEHERRQPTVTPPRNPVVAKAGVAVAITCTTCEQPISKTSQDFGMDCVNDCGRKQWETTQHSRHKKSTTKTTTKRQSRSER